MKWVKTILLAAFFLLTPQFLKPNFKLPPSHLEIPFNSSWEIDPPTPEIIAILNQPFTYLARGNQTTVFTSQDGGYVLKLFRYTRPRFPLVQKLKSFSAHATGKKEKNDLASKMDKTFKATHLACTEGKEFTQVLFCHLNLTKDKFPKVTLKAHRTFTLSLDQHRFVLQKRVDPFKETLLAARNNPEQMNQLIDSFIDLLVQRTKLGIRNSDPNLGPNFGFLNGKAVELDFGNYRKAELRPNEIGNYLTRFEHWLKKNAPEYLDDLHRKSIFLYDEQNETSKKPR